MSEFKSHHVVPDVIDTWPPNVAQVEYDSKNNVNVGNHLEVAHTQNQPKLINWDHEKGSKNNNQYYTLMMVDPDAPNNKTHEYRHWLHWLITNIPESAAHADYFDVHKGNVLAPYKGPAASAESGPHRYVFLVYKQPEQLDTLKLHPINERRNFNISDWMTEVFGTDKKGATKPELWAGNFYAENPHHKYQQKHWN